MYNWAPYVPYAQLSLLTEVDKMSQGIHAMLCLRAFKRALTSPLLFSVEISVALMIFGEVKEDKDFQSFWVHRYSLIGLLVFA